MENKIVYSLYARKSSEAEDRQTLSIESQTGELSTLAIKIGLSIEDRDTLTESHSAKTAYTRPHFEQLIERIEKSEIQGILAWHANRLSRNAIDTARLIELMDRNKLKEIVTPGQTYRNTPQDKLWFTFMCAQAEMDNDQKGIDVRRGLRRKRQLGFPTGVAKCGYKNDYGLKGQRKIEDDPERFPHVKQLLELFLSGNYSVRRLLAYSDQVQGLTTIQRSKEGGVPLKLSRLYDMLKDPFYAGFFYGQDENGDLVRYEVNAAVPRMITEEQYWQIQAMLGNKGRPRARINKQLFPYTGRTKCGGCKGSVTAEHKHQVICADCKHKFAYNNKDACPVCETKLVDMEGAVYLHYIYYHCARCKDKTCKEGAVQEKIIDTAMANHVEDNLAISTALSQWCIRHLDELEENDTKNEYERKANWERSLAQKEKESEELVRMRLKGLITDDTEFRKYKEDIESEKRKIKQVLTEMGGVDHARLTEAKRAFNLVVGIAETFRNGTFEEKQEALSALGSNLTLKDKKLNVINKELFSMLSKGLLEARTQNENFEPRKCEADKDETEVFASVRPTLLDMVREIGTFWKHNKEHIWLPNIKQGFFGIVQPTAEEMAEYR